MILTDALLMNQAVESLLNLLRTCVQFIKKQYIRLLSGNHLRRQKFRSLSLDLRNPDNVLRRKLAAKQRHAVQPYLLRKLLNQRRLANPRRSPYKDRTHRGNI